MVAPQARVCVAPRTPSRNAQSVLSKMSAPRLLLTSYTKQPYSVVGTRHYEAIAAARSSPGHSRPPDIAVAAERPHAWVGQLREDPADLTGRSEGQTGLALPSPPPPRTSGPHHRRMGRLGARTPRALLPFDGGRQKATRTRDRAVGSPERCHRPRAGARLR